MRIILYIETFVEPVCLKRHMLHHAFLPLNSGHPEATPLKLQSCACAVQRYVREQRHVYRAKSHTRYKEVVLALENVRVQVSCIQRTWKKCVLDRQLIGLPILHINKQDRQLYLTILRTNSCTNFTTLFIFHPKL